ncbi:SAF domain-containing protein [Paenibacillus motobuensis]|uniref:SAF domain-containing protein n=1 Tax=Paenibacillus TaxID=44249 RepID=UPI00203F50BA|nr:MULTISPECIES: SAF domain-containing protein [Paenibacillus]MCM3039217.1 SAF domain-containing protein [Paenibacillus lutimineralis]MCM3646321.1 SAF domain-containing protein [Paenibacillus motobuensis]
MIRKRTRQVIYAGIVGAGIVGVAFAGYAVHASSQLEQMRTSIAKQYELEISALKQASGAVVTGWTLSREIPAGERITKQDLASIDLPVNSVPDDWLKASEDIIGKAAKITVAPNTLLTGSLLFEEGAVSDDLRYREMGFIQLPGELKQKDVVDIRIQFPTGQDYILLSKKRVESLAPGVVTSTLNEEEILLLSSGIVDAYLHKASIYALKYVEPYLQREAIPTYPPSDAVLQVIREDPNIIDMAEHALTASIRAGLEGDLASVTSQRAAEFMSQKSSSTSVRTSQEESDSFVLDAGK